MTVEERRVKIKKTNMYPFKLLFVSSVFTCCCRWVDSVCAHCTSVSEIDHIHKYA